MVSRTTLFAAIAAISLVAVHTTYTPAQARATVNLKMKQAQSLYNKSQAASTASPKGNKIWHSGNFRFSNAASGAQKHAVIRAQATPSSNRNSSHRTHRPITLTVRGDENVQVQTYRGGRSRAQFNPKELTISKPVPWQK